MLIYKCCYSLYHANRKLMASVFVLKASQQQIPRLLDDVQSVDKGKFRQDSGHLLDLNQWTRIT